MVLQQRVFGPSQDRFVLRFRLPEFLQPDLVDNLGIGADDLKLVEDDRRLRGTGFNGNDVRVPHVDAWQRITLKALGQRARFTGIMKVV